MDSEQRGPSCIICGKLATVRDVDGEWWPPCKHARTHGIETLQYQPAAVLSSPEDDHE